MGRILTAVIGAWTAGGFTQPVSALDFYEERGGWEIVAADSVCGMSMEYEGEGETRVSLLAGVDREGYLITVTNYRWSAIAGTKYDITYHLNNSAYGGSPSVGYVDGVRKGFMAGFGAEFGRDFAQGSSLHIYRGETLIDQLSLDGTAVAIPRLDVCRSRLRAEVAAEQREKERLAHIPTDPFARPPVPQPPDVAREPKMIMASGWSRRAREEQPIGTDGKLLTGTVRLRIEVNPEGRATDCEVIESSGKPALDTTACASAMKYARFDPAIDEAGNPVSGVSEQGLVYVAQ